jgi:hydroxyethylthiazole kinase
MTLEEIVSVPVTTAARAAANLAAVRRRHPLVHNITNFVVMNLTANALLACGAAPVMAHAREEVEEMAGLAGALVLNIGTLSPTWVDSMLAAGRRANALGTPVILDPVGAGATRLRTDSARRILDEVRLAVVRGNASEVLALAGEDAGARGVDSTHDVEAAVQAAVGLAGSLNTPVVITGEVDLVTDGKMVWRVANGHPLMGRVTGMGCTATAIVGAFLTVEPDPTFAAASALAYLGLAGQRAGRTAAGPASFMIGLLDELYTMTGKDLEEGAVILEARPAGKEGQGTENNV